MIEYDIGSKLKKYRLSKKMTLKVIAEQMGCSIALLSQMENSNISPSIASLYKLSKILNFKLASLFDHEEEEKEVRYEIVRKGQMKNSTRFLSFRNNNNPLFEESHFRKMPNKKMIPFLINLSAKTINAASYDHEGESYIYVMKGQFELFLDSRQIDLREGDSVYIYTPVSQRFSCREDLETTILLLKAVS